MQRKFGEVAVGAHMYEMLGEVVLVGYFDSRIGKASNPNENIGRHGGVTNYESGVDMLKSMKHNETNA